MTWLAGWYNWMFLFPLALAFIFIFLEVILGGLSHSTGDHSFGHDADHDVDHDADHDSQHGFGLTYLGLGKVPISIIGEVLALTQPKMEQA